MTTLSSRVSDEELIAFIDEWAALLEVEDYERAFNYTDIMLETHWTPQRVREVIKAYGDANPNQKGTVRGVPTDITRHKNVHRSSIKEDGYLGYIWYDLNIDSKASEPHCHI